MLLSVIIPTYNERENLIKRLSFLTLETNKFPIEIIITNSPKSSDAIEELGKQFSKVQFFTSPKMGRSHQMNFGASKAKGEIVLFLHADNELPQDFYQDIISAIEKGFKAGFFAYKFDRSSFLLNLNAKFTKKDGLFAGGGDQCQFFNREVFQQLNGYNTEFCIMEDFEMIDRVRKQKIPYIIIQSLATASARKYDTNSWLKVNLINGYVFLRYKLGTKPEKLRKLYKSLLREGV